jgi:hypothetical protein
MNVVSWAQLEVIGRGRIWKYEVPVIYLRRDVLDRVVNTALLAQSSRLGLEV